MRRKNGLTASIRPAGAEGRAPVSVVVPCFRCADTVGRAVHSVANQTWPPAEVLMIDDGNDRATRDALCDLAPSFDTLALRVISLPENRGPGAARNAGWEAATQPFVAFLDADDAWHPQKLALQVPFMQRHPEFSITGHAMASCTSVHAPDALRGEVRFRPVSRRELLVSNRLSTPSAVVRRLLPLRFSPDQRYSEDYGLWLEAVCRGERLAVSDAVLGTLFKAPYGASGLSAALWRMERGELENYRALYRKRLIGWGACRSLEFLSLAKYARRVVWTLLRRRLARGGA
jgi:glycosyltransferase involved in cell wall biosynthesis